MVKIKKSIDLERIKDLVRDLVELREVKDETEKTIKWTQQELVEWFDANKRKTLKVDNDDVSEVKATKVEQSRIKIDEEKLKKALGAKTYNKVTKKVLDKEKLEELVAEGEIDPNVVAQCSTEKKVEFIKITYNKKDPEEVEDADEDEG